MTMDGSPTGTVPRRWWIAARIIEDEESCDDTGVGREESGECGS